MSNVSRCILKCYFFSVITVLPVWGTCESAYSRCLANPKRRLEKIQKCNARVIVFLNELTKKAKNTTFLCMGEQGQCTSASCDSIEVKDLLTYFLRL